MKAIGYKTPSPISAADSFVDIELPKPEPKGRDILVEVKAISVNPVDYKVRGSTPPADGTEWKVLGWDVAGIVAAVGPDVAGFKVGEEVWYAGSITRSGANAEFHLVDERIVGKKPSKIGWADAAALPLTSLTAWEAFFVRLDVKKPVPGAAAAILIIGGAGGVGSIAVQIARQFTSLTVIATASRPETRDFVASLGAHHVVDHSKPIAGQVAALGIGAPAFVFSTTQTAKHIDDIAELIAPQGRLCLIDDPSGFDIMKFKRKAVSIHHELMFTRSIFQTPDMDEQGRILNEMSSAVDDGKIRSTAMQNLGSINAQNLKKAHAQLESGTTIGKVVLEGFAWFKRWLVIFEAAERLHRSFPPCRPGASEAPYGWRCAPRSRDCSGIGLTAVAVATGRLAVRVTAWSSEAVTISSLNEAVFFQFRRRSLKDKNYARPLILSDHEALASSSSGLATTLLITYAQWCQSFDHAGGNWLGVRAPLG